MAVSGYSKAIPRTISLSVADSIVRSYSFVIRGSEWYPAGL